MLCGVCLAIVTLLCVAIDAQPSTKLNQVLLAINATVNYLVTHPKSDSNIMSNMLIIEGQLRHLLRSVNKENLIDKHHIDIMQQIVDTIQPENDLIREVNVHGLLNGKNNWEFGYATKMTNVDMAYQWMDTEVVSDKIYQHCMSQIIIDHPCAITKFCWKYMTAANKSIDYLTKQLFYLLMADNHGCASVMTSLAEWNGQTSLESIYDRICSTIQPTLMSDTDSQVWHDPVFFQMLSCGILGFKDVFTSSSKRIDYLMSLQRQDGCMSDVPQRPSSGFSWLIKLIGLSPSEGECFPTRSSLAAAVFTQFIRYLIEEPELVGY